MTGKYLIKFLLILYLYIDWKNLLRKTFEEYLRCWMTVLGKLESRREFSVKKFGKLFFVIWDV
jgi:hypothetical protein